MQYRQFGKLNFQVSALGFGAMRLPTQNGKVDAPEAIRMMRQAIDQGVNYVDTAYPYHSGESEVVVGRALQDGYRAQVKLATKLPTWLVHTAADFDRLFNEQLQRLQTDSIDFYLIHALNHDSWPKMRDLGVLTWAEQQIAAGRIKYLGFSFHDKGEAFQPIVDAYDWTFCQIQYNYMDLENQAGTKGLQYAAQKGIAMVIMEPVLGGRLIDPPPKIQAVFDAADKKRTAADWALQWLWNLPEVATVLSGMSTMQQVAENLGSADRSGINSLTGSDLAVIDQVRAQYQTLAVIPCTKCEYCMPCPSGVNIPRNFEIYNEGLIFDKPESARQGYNIWTPKDQRALNCTQCQECEEHCPQSIAISQWMPLVHNVLGEGKPYQKTL